MLFKHIPIMHMYTYTMQLCTYKYSIHTYEYSSYTDTMHSREGGNTLAILLVLTFM